MYGKQCLFYVSSLNISLFANEHPPLSLPPSTYVKIALLMNEKKKHFKFWHSNYISISILQSFANNTLFNSTPLHHWNRRNFTVKISDQNKKSIFAALYLIDGLIDEASCHVKISNWLSESSTFFLKRVREKEPFSFHIEF